MNAQQLTPPGGWHSADAHLPPLAPAEFSAPMRLFFRLAGKWARKRTGSEEIPSVFFLLLRHPRLFWPWLRFASRLMPHGTLDRRDAELVILRVGWNCRCRYEWGQHVIIGLREGLTTADIARIAHGPAHHGWSPQRAALLQATDDLHHERTISPATWQRLAAHFSQKQLIEIGMLIGHYQMLAGILNSTGLPLEAATVQRLTDTAIDDRG